MPILNRRSLLWTPKSVHDPAAAGGSTLKTGLISFWEFENTSWTDAVGGNDLTGHGSPTSVSGLVGNCANFVAASSQYLDHTDTSSLSYSGDFSIGAWINAASFTDGVVIASKSASFGNREWLLALKFNGGFNVAFDVYDSGSVKNEVISTPTIVADGSTWYYVVGTYTASNNLMNIYINAGTPDSTNLVPTFGGPSDGADPFSVGGDGTAGDYFDGKIDQVGFWKKVLTSTEITQLRNGGSGLSYAAM